MCDCRPRSWRSNSGRLLSKGSSRKKQLLMQLLRQLIKPKSMPHLVQQLPSSTLDAGRWTGLHESVPAQPCYVGVQFNQQVYVQCLCVIYNTVHDNWQLVQTVKYHKICDQISASKYNSLWCVVLDSTTCILVMLNYRLVYHSVHWPT